MKSDSSEGLLSAHLELWCDSVHYLGDAGLLGGKKIKTSFSKERKTHLTSLGKSDHMYQFNKTGKKGYLLHYKSC